MKARLFTVLSVTILICSLFMACTDSSDEAGQFTSSPVSLETSSGTLYGILELPLDAEDVPVILIIAGSGPTDRDGNSAIIPGANNSLKMVAEELAKNGYASVRYDKRGIGESEIAGINEEDLRFDDYVNDAVVWIDKLKDDSRFSLTGIIGHSEGALIGMLAAARSNTDIYVSIAGSGRPANNLILEQLYGQPEEIISEVARINSELKAGNLVDDVNPVLYSLFRPSVQPYLISWYKYDPAIEITKLTCPVLIIQGSTDIQMAPRDAEILHAAKPDSVYELIEGMNHILKNAPIDQAENLATYGDPDLPLTEDFIRALITFLEEYI